MRPFLVTAPEARRLPYWALATLLAFYILPGFIGRDPWRSADAIGFGIAHAMFAGPWSQWLLTEVAGQAVTQSGPLAYWFAAIVARLLHGLSFGLIDAAAGVRLAAAGLLALGLLLLRAATARLASRAEAQPLDPFGAGAGPLAYGRAVADASLLLALATFGLIARVHETTAEAAMLTVTAGFLFGLARACDAPRAGGIMLGAAIAAAALVRTPAVASLYLLSTLLACIAVRPLRLNARVVLPVALLVATALILPWPLALNILDRPEATAQLSGWFGWSTATSGATVQFAWAARTLPWFLWPSWPIAARTLWLGRNRFEEAPIGVPLSLSVVLLLGLSVALFTGRASEASLIPLTIPMAMLAALGLPTLARSITRLIDWFTVIVFSLFGLAVWAWWVAWITGWPAKLAAQSTRFAAGFSGMTETAAFLPALTAGLLASIGWLTLVRWRLARRPPMLWRPVILAGAGMSLAWFLLMTLWMPVFDWRNTYREVGRQLRGQVAAEPDACVEARGLDLAQRASLAWFSGLEFAREDQPKDCPWLLLADRRGLTQATVADQWKPVWEGRRPADRNERFRLYRRTVAQP